jgi:circadian clock protein KaiB
MNGARVRIVRLRLRLYVAGSSPNSLRAITNARALCAEHFASAHELEIIDLLRDAERPPAATLLADGITVTPMLLKLAPAPTQRLIGNLNDLKQVLMILVAK